MRSVASKLEVFNSVSLQMIEYLESVGVRDVEFDGASGASAEQLSAWAGAHAPYRLPDDLVAFLGEFDGVRLSWRAASPKKGREEIGRVRIGRVADVDFAPLDLEENDPKLFEATAAVCFESYPTIGRVGFVVFGDNDDLSDSSSRITYCRVLRINLRYRLLGLNRHTLFALFKMCP